MEEVFDRILDLDGDVCPARAKSYSACKTLQEVKDSLHPVKLRIIEQLYLPGTAFGDNDVPEIDAFVRTLPSLKYVNLNGQHLCGPNSRALLVYLLVDRNVAVDVYESPSFARLAKSLVAELPGAALQRLRF